MRSISGLVTVLLLLVAACRSSDRIEIDEKLMPRIALEQLGGTSFIMQYQGPLTVGYRMEVFNPREESIVLQKVELQTLGIGPYTLRADPVIFSKTIGSRRSEVVEFSVSAWSQGGRNAPLEPVVIRGVAQFTGPDGLFQKVFTTRLRQPQSGE